MLNIIHKQCGGFPEWQKASLKPSRRRTYSTTHLDDVRGPVTHLRDVPRRQQMNEAPGAECPPTAILASRWLTGESSLSTTLRLTGRPEWRTGPSTWRAQYTWLTYGGAQGSVGTPEVKAAAAAHTRLRRNTVVSTETRKCHKVIASIWKI